MSSQSSSGSTRVRRLHPQRLDWPRKSPSLNGCKEEEDDHHAVSSPSQASSSRPAKRSRRVAFQKPTKKDQLWIEKYVPIASKDLVVAPKKVKEVASWLRNPSKLLVLVGSPGIGKSAMIYCLTNELSTRVIEWTESFSNGYGDLPIESFQHFLEESGGGLTLLQGTAQTSIILIDELPNLHGPEAEARFRDMFTRHIQESNIPTVLIYSDTVEGKTRPDALERLIEKRVLYSNVCQILQIHPPTKARFGKVVQQIASAEGGRVGDVEELYTRCHGDIRFAIATLQCELAGKCNGKLSLKSPPQQRDTKLSSFHALGKLLYAKRQKGSNGEQRPPLEFDPEQVMEQSEMELSGSLHFLGYHAPDFFTDNQELATAFSHFSDAAVLLDRRCPYASSLASRAVANANRHPAPNKFRQLSAPGVFQVLRKRRDNQGRIQSLSTKFRVDPAIYATDIMPYARTIAPNYALISLDSYFDSSRRSGDRPTREAEEEERYKREQDEILQMDDIVDSDNEQLLS